MNGNASRGRDTPLPSQFARFSKKSRCQSVKDREDQQDVLKVEKKVEGCGVTSE